MIKKNNAVLLFLLCYIRAVVLIYFYFNKLLPEYFFTSVGALLLKYRVLVLSPRLRTDQLFPVTLHLQTLPQKH